MQEAMAEMARRRERQLEHNAAHGIEQKITDPGPIRLAMAALRCSIWAGVPLKFNPARMVIIMRMPWLSARSSSALSTLGGRR